MDHLVGRKRGGGRSIDHNSVGRKQRWGRRRPSTLVSSTLQPLVQWPRRVGVCTTSAHVLWTRDGPWRVRPMCLGARVTRRWRSGMHPPNPGQALDMAVSVRPDRACTLTTCTSSPYWKTVTDQGWKAVTAQRRSTPPCAWNSAKNQGLENGQRILAQKMVPAV